MRLIDLSQPVYHDSPNCPAHPPVRSELVTDHPESGWRVELLTLASHTGSHVDAPLHKIAGGASLDDIALERWCGPAFLADFRGVAAGTQLTAGMLAAKLPPALPAPQGGMWAEGRVGGEQPDNPPPVPSPTREGDPLADAIVLLATGWGEKRAKTDEWLRRSPCLAVDGARWLVERRIRGVGIDHYSIGGGTEPTNERVHTVLLGAGVWVVEELRFPPEVFALPQPVNYMGLPVNLRGHTGAFCRPVIVLP